MNNLTRQLYKQAVQFVADSSTQGDVSRLNVNSRYVQDLIDQKFAELIVRKCANIAFDEYATTNGAASGESAILKHFGIEE